MVNSGGTYIWIIPSENTLLVVTKEKLYGT